MSQKSKNTQTTLDKLAEVSQQAGLMLMTLAATAGMLELPSHPNSRIITPSRPAFAMATEDDEINNPLRRESQESDQHSISYSIAQRTPGRFGRR